MSEKLNKSIKKILSIGFVQALLEDVKILQKMLGALCKGDFKVFRVKTLLKFVFAGVYLVVPTDLIPDFIPFLGQVDDLGVALWFFYDVKQDIERFKEIHKK